MKEMHEDGSLEDFLVAEGVISGKDIAER